MTEGVKKCKEGKELGKPCIDVLLVTAYTPHKYTIIVHRVPNNSWVNVLTGQRIAPLPKEFRMKPPH